MKHLLSLLDLNPAELAELLDLADELKSTRLEHGAAKPLAGRSVAMIFSKSSTRTRVSFQVGIYELGGNAMFFDKGTLQLGRGETMADTARVLSRYVHGIVIRYHAHADVVELAELGHVPVINALTDRYHPCQLLADLMTIREAAGRLAGLRVAYLGDGSSNMASSWVMAARLAGLELRIGAPVQYQPEPKIISGAPGNGAVVVSDDPAAAVKDADFIYTDVWVSMGCEAEAEDRLRTLKPYQVNAELMAAAPPGAKVMHCLPAYRGKEITAGILDGPQAIVWDQAENRLHVQKAVMARLFT